MKQNKGTNPQITKSILGELIGTHKTNEKVAVAKLVVQEVPVKSPDLSHDAGGAYNADLSVLQK